MIAPHKCPYCDATVSGRSLVEIHEKLINHAREDHDIRLPGAPGNIYTHEISLNVYVKNPEEWNAVWDAFGKLVVLLRPQYPEITVTSIDIGQVHGE